MRGLKLLASVVAITAFVVPARGVIAKRDSRTVIQPDGTAINIRVVGDEHLHFTTTEDGVLLRLDDDGFYNYGCLSEDGSTVVATGVRYIPASSYENAVNIENINVGEMKEKRNARLRVAPQTGIGLTGTTFPTTGSPKGLVILVEYSDVRFTLDDAADYFNDMINGENFTQYDGTGSVLQYFTDQSQGKFTPKFDVYGPVVLPNTRAYYGHNDSYGNDVNAYMMVVDAIDILDSKVDFSQYDNDGDEVIDNVYVIYAGHGESSYGSEETVWPHSWDVRSDGITRIVDGVSVGRYACSNEWEYNKPDGIGTFVHEFSHVMGLPDLYNTSDPSARYTPADYSVLDYGPYNNSGRTPPNYGAYERNALGWMEPVEVEDVMSLTLNPITSGEYVLIPTSKANEFFLLENRQQVGWDKYIPYHGMLIWHIDYNASIFSKNIVNKNPSHQYVDIIEANNSAYFPDAKGWPFPGVNFVTDFTSTTVPTMKEWSGRLINKAITEIEENGKRISFNVSGGETLLETPIGYTDNTSEHPGSFVASWTEVEGATDYLLTVYAISPEGTKDVTGNGQNGEILDDYDAVSTNGATTYLVDRLLDNVDDYYFTVQATDGYVTSNFSEPVHVKVALNESGIENITVDDNTNTSPQYYNLQGVRIFNPTPGSIVICRRGAQTSKMVVR